MIARFRLAFRAMLVLAVLSTMTMPVSLINAPTMIQAQEDDPDDIVIAGSGYLFLEAMVENWIATYQDNVDSDSTFSIEAQGNNDGFERLCSGTTDFTMATREISDEEIINCQENGVEFVEILLAVDGLALATDVENEVSCIPYESVATIFQSEAPPTWNAIVPTGPEVPIDIFGPQSLGRGYTLLTILMDNVEPRVEYEPFEEPAEIIEAISQSDENDLGFMTLAEWNELEDTDDTALLSLSSPQSTDCVAPTAGSLSTGEYPATLQMLMYVNAASLEDAAIQEFVQFGLGEDEAPIEERPLAGIAAAEGFTAPVQAIFDRNSNNIRGPITGRTFTRTTAPASVNTATEGEITVRGASISTYGTQTLFDSFNTTFPNITVDLKPYGEERAWQALCNGEVSAIQTSGAPSDDILELCAANDITPFEIYYGSQAVVMVVSAESTLPACLNSDQVAQILFPEDIADTGDAEEDAETSGEDVPSGDADTADTPDEEENVASDEATEAPTAEDDEDTEVQRDEEATTDAAPSGEESAESDSQDTEEDTANAEDTNAAEDDSETTDEDTSGDAETESDGDAETSADDSESDTPEQPAPPTPQGPTNWSEIFTDETDLDLPLVVLVPDLGVLETDIVHSIAVPTRDTLRRTDEPTIQETPAETGFTNEVDYRLASVAANDGAITYVFWDTYASYENRDSLRLMAIDTGAGCVPPSVETITDGSYPIAFDVRLVVAEEALNEPVTASLLWHSLSREGLSALETLDLVGFDRVELETRRGEIFTLIDEATAAADDAPPADDSETPPPAEDETETPSSDPEAEASDDEEPGDSATDAPEESDGSESEDEPAESETDSTGEDSPADGDSEDEE